jgi:hypothetical protein
VGTDDQSARSIGATARRPRPADRRSSVRDDALFDFKERRFQRPKFGMLETAVDESLDARGNGMGGGRRPVEELEEIGDFRHHDF